MSRMIRQATTVRDSKVVLLEAVRRERARPRLGARSSLDGSEGRPSTAPAQLTPLAPSLQAPQLPTWLPVSTS